MTDARPTPVEATLPPPPHRAQITMSGVDRPRQQSALLVAAIPALRVESLRHLQPEPPAIPPVVELPRHRHGGDVIAVEFRRMVPPQIIREDHAAAAGVTAEYATKSLDSNSLGRRGVVEARRGRYSDAREGSPCGVAGGGYGRVSHSKDDLICQHAEDASDIHHSVACMVGRVLGDRSIEQWEKMKSRTRTKEKKQGEDETKIV
jgi:hypothetical protein